MSRISLLLVAAVVAAGVVGCAQCDTCDDFPAPCTGPNCGQNRAGVLDYMPAETMANGPAAMGASTPNAGPTNDQAGPAPSAPTTPPTPAVDPTTPPPASDPATMPK